MLLFLKALRNRTLIKLTEYKFSCCLLLLVFPFRGLCSESSSSISSVLYTPFSHTSYLNVLSNYLILSGLPLDLLPTILSIHHNYSPSSRYVQAILACPLWPYLQII